MDDAWESTLQDPSITRILVRELVPLEDRNWRTFGCTPYTRLSAYISRLPGIAQGVFAALKFSFLVTSMTCLLVFALVYLITML